MKYKITIAIMLMVFDTTSLKAQPAKHEFGKVTPEELKMTSYDRDTTAGAVILYDKGESSFIQVERGYYTEFDIQFIRTTRIKIFKKSAYSYASVEIPYYTDGFGKTERIIDVNAVAINVVDGRVEKSELKKADIHQKKVSEKWSKKIFTIPNVREGTIIEYTYTLESPFIGNFPDWQFQSKIPTVYSEYEVRMTPFYKFVYLLQGIHGFDYSSSIKDEVSREFFGTKFNDYINRYVMKHTPAFKDEAFISSIDDYIMKMDFQLSNSSMINGGNYQHLTTWKKLNNTLLKHDGFGKYIGHCEKLVQKNGVSGLPFKGVSDAEKCQRVVESIRKNYEWNRQNSKYAVRKAKDVFKSKKGNSAELNLLLFAALKAYGFEVSPVLISTRDHGKVNKEYPFEHFFNNVIVLVRIEGAYFFTEATDKLSGFKQIPANCLNGVGHLVLENESKWVTLKDYTNTTSIRKINIKIDPVAENAQVEIVEDALGYDARKGRELYYSENKLREAYLSRGFSDIDRIKILNKDKLERPFITAIEATYPLESVDGMITVPPFLDFPMSENVLKQENRKYPVDMVYSNVEKYETTIELPEGYAIDEMPRAISIDNDMAQIKYRASQNDGTVKISGTVSFKKASYGQHEYKQLRRYFSLIVKKFNESLLLKKA